MLKRDASGLKIRVHVTLVSDEYDCDILRYTQALLLKQKYYNALAISQSNFN